MPYCTQSSFGRHGGLDKPYPADQKSMSIVQHHHHDQLLLLLLLDEVLIEILLTSIHHLGPSC